MWEVVVAWIIIFAVAQWWFRFIITVREGEAFLCFRWGRYCGTLTRGFNIVLPWVHRVSEPIPQGRLLYTMQPFDSYSVDHVSITLEGTISYIITEPVKYVLMHDRAKEAIELTVQGSLLEHISTRSWKKNIIVNPKELIPNILKNIEEVYGVAQLEVMLKRPRISDSIINYLLMKQSDIFQTKGILDLIGSINTRVDVISKNMIEHRT